MAFRGVAAHRLIYLLCTQPEPYCRRLSRRLSASDDVSVVCEGAMTRYRRGDWLIGICWAWSVKLGDGGEQAPPDMSYRKPWTRRQCCAGVPRRVVCLVTGRRSKGMPLLPWDGVLTANSCSRRGPRFPLGHRRVIRELHHADCMQTVSSCKVK